MKIQMRKPIHSTSYRVLYGDTDAAGVVYYGNYMRYFEIGRTEFMRDLVRSYKEIEDEGLVLPVIENYARYKASASYDDLLTIQTSLAEVKNVSCRFNYRIYLSNDPDKEKSRLLVKGYTVHASVNRKGKISKLPKDVLNSLKKICFDPS